jgi:hypothetical protein
VYFELHMIDGDSSVRIYGSIHSKTEDIFNRLEGGPDLECECVLNIVEI